MLIVPFGRVGIIQYIIATMVQTGIEIDRVVWANIAETESNSKVTWPVWGQMKFGIFGEHIEKVQPHEREQ